MAPAPRNPARLILLNGVDDDAREEQARLARRGRPWPGALASNSPLGRRPAAGGIA